MDMPAYEEGIILCKPDYTHIKMCLPDSTESEKEEIRAVPIGEFMALERLWTDSNVSYDKSIRTDNNKFLYFFDQYGYLFEHPEDRPQNSAERDHQYITKKTVISTSRFIKFFVLLQSYYGASFGKVELLRNLISLIAYVANDFDPILVDMEEVEDYCSKRGAPRDLYDVPYYTCILFSLARSTMSTDADDESLYGEMLLRFDKVEKNYAYVRSLLFEQAKEDLDYVDIHYKPILHEHDILIDLIKIYKEISPFYIDEFGATHFKEEALLTDEFFLKNAHLLEHVNQLAETVINDTKKKLAATLSHGYFYDGKNMLIDLNGMYNAVCFAILFTDFNTYGYFPCYNPRCPQFIFKSQELAAEHHKKKKPTKVVDRCCTSGCAHRLSEYKSRKKKQESKSLTTP